MPELKKVRYKLPKEIKVNREVAENLKFALRGVLDYERINGTLYFSESDREAINAFIGLMDDKDKRTIEYLKNQQ